MKHAVSDLMRAVAAAEILPRFRKLATHEILAKGTDGDLVTIADHASELALTAGLQELLPNAMVVGEEAVAANPDIISHIGDYEHVWVVDPLDGTRNFAAGRDEFAMIVCLCHHGVTVAGWILDILDNEIAIAEYGKGVYIGSEKISLSPAKVPYKGFYGAQLSRRFLAHGAFDLSYDVGCAGQEYLAMLRGKTDFVVYNGENPWDHAAGVLMIAEAGGVVGWRDRTPYLPTQRGRGLIGASSQALWDVIAAI